MFFCGCQKKVHFWTNNRKQMVVDMTSRGLFSGDLKWLNRTWILKNIDGIWVVDKIVDFLCFVCWNLTSDLALKLTIKFSQSLALNQVSANQTLTIADKRWNQRKWLSETKNVVNETRQTKQKHTQKTETCRQRLRWIYSSSPLDQVGQDSQQGCHLCGRRRLEMRGDHWELEPVNSSYLVLNSDLFSVLIYYRE